MLLGFVDANAQINLNKLGKQIKGSAEQQVEQKTKEKAARETREALDNSEKKLDQSVSNANSDETSNNKKEQVKTEKEEEQIEKPDIAEQDNKGSENNSKKDNKPSAEAGEEHRPIFKKLRHKHSAVESNINELEHRGLDRCPDKGYNNFKRYVGLSVCAYNLRKIGEHLIHIKRQKEAPSKQKRAAW